MTFTGYGYSQGQMKRCICLSPTTVGCFCPWHFSVWYPYVNWLWSEVKTAQSRLTLCDPIDYTVHGILRARILSRVAFPFSRGSSQPRDWAGVSCIAGGFFIWKDPDVWKDWRWEEKGAKEDEMVGWHHRLDGYEFEQAPGVGDGQGGLAFCSPCGCKDFKMTRVTELNWFLFEWSLAVYDIKEVIQLTTL